jgi:hypothetical protein
MINPTIQVRPIMTKRVIALAAALVLATACKDATSIPDLNQVSSTLLAGGLNRASVQLLATGLLNSDRANYSERYLVFTETMARDMYRIDQSEQRWINQTIGAGADPTSFVGGGLWAGYYAGIKAANNLIDNIGTASDLSASERAATVGLAQTFKALQYWHVVETRDSLGLPIAVDNPITAPPAPFVCKADGLAYVSSLLDSAFTQLQAAGATPFPFSLPAGFTVQGDYSSPAALALWNRGLKGKIEYYRGMDHSNPNVASFATAVAALTQAIGTLDPATLNNSVYYSYSTAPGETENPYAGDQNVHLNPEVADSIQTGDLRAAKIILGAGPYTNWGVTTSDNMAYAVPTDPTNLTRPLPILKIAELILVRAQAEIETGAFAAATADVNFVRTNLGGLAALPTFASAAAGRAAVLYEKRYTMLFESAHRLVDLRAYGFLNGTYLRKEIPSDVFEAALPIPETEILGRGGIQPTFTCP